MRPTLVWLTLMAALGGLASHASARTNCEFIQVDDTQTLRADCETDETLYIPIGVTWDGAGHRIVAVDPPGGHFTGAIVRNAGPIAHVRNLTVEARGLTGSVCDAAGLALRGILFESASGTIRRSRALNINQGVGNGCQEGHGIEVRNPPYDGNHPQTQRVDVSDNYVEGYQKTGILINGDVVANVRDNCVLGYGPIDFIAQNGIQIGYGATAHIRSNRIEGNEYVGGDWGAAGILLLHAGDQVEVHANRIHDNDIGVWLSATNAADVSFNTVRASSREAVLIESVDGTAHSNHVGANWLEESRIGVTLYGAETTENEVARNVVLDQTLLGIQVLDAGGNIVEHNKLSGRTEFGVWLRGDANELTGNWIRTRGVGIHIEGDDNAVRWNVVHARFTDLENDGDNQYSHNHCHDASGVPIDCPHR